MFRGDLATNIKHTDRYNNNNNNNNNNKQVMMLSTGKRNKPSSEDMNRLKPPLHNFDLPWLKWGNQKLLRCMNVDSNADVSVLDRNHSFGGIGTSRRNSDSVKRFRSSYDYDNNNRKTDRFCKFSTSEKVNVVRNHSPDNGGAGDGNGCTIGGRRRSTEYDNDRETESCYRFSSSESYGGGTIGRKRFRSSYDDVDRKTESFYNLSSSEKLPARNGIGTGNLITGDGEIEATREKLMFDFQTEVVKMKETILRERLVNPPPSTAATVTATAAVEATPSDNPPATERPWNLRTRRSPAKGGNKSGEVLEHMSSPARKVRPANGGSDEAASGDRPKFSVSLLRREIEEDFMAMAGRRLPRKPKKRPRVVQKQLDTLFPGLWLSEITADLYKVPDEAEAGKR